MAPIEATVSLSLREGVTDNARAQELYKYYQPSVLSSRELRDSSRDASSPAPSLVDAIADHDKGVLHSPDAALNAFCQLVTWRVRANRAMISVIDSRTQYFLAESTRTVDLVDHRQHGLNDGLWMGCSRVDKDGRLCERTIKQLPESPGEFPAFIVPNLSIDPRFSALPFVTGPPFLRFYAGTPLITKRGIPIGSLFVVDDQPRPGLSKGEIHFMGTMAQTIMTHLELTREVEEHRLSMKMSRGLASFVEGRAQLVEADADTEDEETQTATGRFDRHGSASNAKSRSARGSVAESVSSVDRKVDDYSHSMVKAEQAIMTSGAEASTAQSTRIEWLSDSRGTSYDVDHPHSQPATTAAYQTDVSSPTLGPGESATSLLFSRAANLIREAFELDGTIFYDAQKSFVSEFSREQQPKAEPTLAGESVGDVDEFKSSQEPQSFVRASMSPDKMVEVVGFSTAGAASIHGDKIPAGAFAPVDEKSLHVLLRRYPRGRLWSFDEDGAISSSDEDASILLAKANSDRAVVSSYKVSRKVRRDAEARFLSRHFPGVRQLLFVPLWDAGRTRWLSGCFSWSTDHMRILSTQSELAFLTAFGNSVMAECSRIDTELADQKKSDFIGSISHELRSPLHGILASAEFLGEETTEGFGKELVETINSCGRTLLDTINHILDYSKINNFEKDWRRSRRGGGGSRSQPTTRGVADASALRHSNIPMINLFAEVDVSVICEEVVESVFAGHVFQNVTASSFDMVPDSNSKMSDPKRHLGSADSSGTSQASHHPDVAVILDVSMQDYNFTTQPGAFRRVIMNLLGNALKYTSSGYVKISLAAEEMDNFQVPGTLESIPRMMVVLSVTDTGRGIASEFLRTKLFTPFAQEDSLSAGTGLGLSIIRSIVALLEGDIQIKSELGKGTEVRVTLPLLRDLPRTSSSSESGSKPTVVAPLRDVDDSIESLRTQVVGKTASLLGFEMQNKNVESQRPNKLLHASLTNYLTQWYGLKLIDSESADIIIMDEADPRYAERLSRFRSRHRRSPSILVLCSHTSFQRSHHEAALAKGNNISYMTKPVGPLKLARALLQCVNGTAALPTPSFSSSTTTSQLNVLTPGGGSSSADLGATTDLAVIFQNAPSSRSSNHAIFDSSRLAADSDNARKAIESPTPQQHVESKGEFPFPIDAERHAAAVAAAESTSGPASPRLSPQPAGDQPASSPAAKARLQERITAMLIPKSLSSPPPPKNLPHLHSSLSSSSPSSSSSSSSAAAAALATGNSGGSSGGAGLDPGKFVPSLLLVDDNKINLRLLSTYMRKRRIPVIDEAENGLEAVEAVEKRAAGYDIIFMDVSMPVLDGFGATRRIRKLEKARLGESSLQQQQQQQQQKGQHRGSSSGGGGEGGRGGGGSGGPPQQMLPALVIALTGLASAKDQNEAFASGVDLFVTKPVSFKEVGKIMDNWEANRAREAAKNSSAAGAR